MSALPTNEDWTEYDWPETFAGGCDYSGTFEAGNPASSPIADMTADRIAEVIHFHAYSPEGYGSVDFFAIVKTTDGHFAVSEAWADTTGWGCRADAWWKVGPTYESVMAELSEENRRRLQDSTP